MDPNFGIAANITRNALQLLLRPRSEVEIPIIESLCGCVNICGKMEVEVGFCLKKEEMFRPSSGEIY
jgi:hypothetical protein